jgi:hypothetical protein
MHGYADFARLMNRLLLTFLVALVAWLPVGGAVHAAHAHANVAQCTSADAPEAGCPATSCTLCIAFAALGSALASPGANAPLLAARPPLLAPQAPAFPALDRLTPSSRDPPHPLA